MTPTVALEHFFTSACSLSLDEVVLILNNVSHFWLAAWWRRLYGTLVQSRLNYWLIEEHVSLSARLWFDPCGIWLAYVLGLAPFNLTFCVTVLRFPSSNGICLLFTFITQNLPYK